MATDSNEKLLSIPEIIVANLKEQNVEQRMVAPYVLAIVKEGAMPDTDVRQFGNTVFISHFKTKNDTKVVFGRAFNVDTARNYLTNGEEYFKYLIQEKVDYFVTIYTDSRLSIIFKYIQRPEVQARVGGTAEVQMRESNGRFGATVKIEASK